MVKMLSAQITWTHERNRPQKRFNFPKQEQNGALQEWCIKLTDKLDILLHSSLCDIMTLL